MCSILGIISPKKLPTLDTKSKNLIPKLIRANAYRGGDGAGIWSEKWGLIKGVKLNVIKEFMRRSDDSTFLVHLRKATSGDVSNAHCHPFKKSGVVLCHNGHISNFTQFKVAMDSLAGLHAVVKGQDEINKLSGWFVLAWIDNRDKTFNLLNHDGSIQYGWFGKRLVFASTGLKKYVKKVYEVPQNTWYSFNINSEEIIRLDAMQKINPIAIQPFYFSDDEYYVPYRPYVLPKEKQHRFSW